MAAEQPQQSQPEDTEEFLLDEMAKETMSFIRLLVRNIYSGPGNTGGFRLTFPDEHEMPDSYKEKSGDGGAGLVRFERQMKNLRPFKEQLPNYIRNMVMYTNRLNAVYERQRNNTERVNKVHSASKPPPEVPLGEVSIGVPPPSYDEIINAASTQPSVYETVASRLQGGKLKSKTKRTGGYNLRTTAKKTKNKSKTKRRSLKR